MRNQFEQSWWGNCINTIGEEIKQLEYARLLKLPFFHDGKSPYNLDFRGLSVLDIGGGPVSILLKACGAKRLVVIDPLDLPEWVKMRYKEAGIEYIQMRGEDISSGDYDLCLIYNVLQHCDDPIKILENAKRVAKEIRIFDWIDTNPSPGHPQTLTKELLDNALGINGEVGFLNKYDGHLVGKYYVGIWKRQANIVFNKHPDHYRFHYVGLAHLPVSNRYSLCAFTKKAVLLGKMLTSLGHEFYLYGPEGSDAPCTKLYETHSLEDIRKEWGDKPPREDFEIGYDYTAGQFRHDFNSAPTHTKKKYIKNAIKLINENKRDDDFLLLSMGYYQKEIADNVGLFLTCEPGVGYRGSFARFRAFESAYIQNFTYGSEHPRESINGNYYDRVIPNYLDPEEFPFSPEPKDYFVYIGRLILRKGVWTAVKATQAIGAKLILAGQPDDEIDIKDLPGNCEYIGTVNPKERAELLGGAIALFLPTIYLEPFGTTHIEALAVGTPVLTTNFGVFGGDTFKDGVHGFKCNTLDDFIFGAKNAHKLDRREVRKAGERFFIDNVKWEYQRWFDDLYQLYLSARYENVPGWHNIRTETPEWRKKMYKEELWS